MTITLISLAAIAPKAFRSIKALEKMKPVLDRINQWTQQTYGDNFLEVNWQTLKEQWWRATYDREGFIADVVTENPLYRVTGAGIVVQPKPWAPAFPGYGTVWIERIDPDATRKEDEVIGSKRFAMHPQVVLD